MNVIAATVYLVGGYFLANYVIHYEEEMEEGFLLAALLAPVMPPLTLLVWLAIGRTEKNPKNKVRRDLALFTCYVYAAVFVVLFVAGITR